MRLDLFLPAQHATVHATLMLLVRLNAARRALLALASLAAARLAAAAPVLRPVLAAFFSLPSREHVGSRPRPPTTFGVALAEDIAEADWPAAAEALGRLLAWAHDSGFRLVLVYEPAGCLQQAPQLRQLELQLLQQRLTSAVQLQVGWCPQQGAAATTTTAAAERQAPGMAPVGGPGVGAADRSLLAVLLAAADGEWPLLAAGTTVGPAEGPEAAGAAWNPSGQQAEEQSPAGGVVGDATDVAAALDAAIAAPTRLRERLQAAAGPLAGAEPDFVLVTGPALTLARFPAWAVRASEIYGVGPLAALQGRRELDAALRRFCGTKQRWGK